MTPRAFILLVLLAFMTVPAAFAQSTEGTDIQITITADAEPSSVGPEGILLLTNSTAGEHYEWNATFLNNYTTIEFRVKAGAFDIVRPRQAAPFFYTENRRPTFEPVAWSDVWNVDGPAKISNHSYDGTDLLVRVGIPGPANGTLILTRDVILPEITPEERQNMTHIGFFQRTRTNEFSIVNLQVRKLGTTEWVDNPTPEYDRLQNFPIQGLAADAEHETRFLVTDWAGNVLETPVTTFRTPAAPVYPTATITALTPGPNATVNESDFVVIRASISSPESPVHSDGVRLFFDLKEIRDDFTVADGILTYTPPSLAPGKHRVAVEVTTADGGFSRETWTFDVAKPTAETPGAGLALILAGVAFAALAWRRRG